MALVRRPAVNLVQRSHGTRTPSDLDRGTSPSCPKVILIFRIYFQGENLMFPHRQRASGNLFFVIWKCTNQDEPSAAGSFLLNKKTRYMSSQINLMNSDTMKYFIFFKQIFKNKRRRRNWRKTNGGIQSPMTVGGEQYK
jgi:hypothetical protein